MSPTTDDHDRFNEQRNLNLNKFDKAISLVTCLVAGCGLGAVVVFIFLILKGVL